MVNGFGLSAAALHIPTIDVVYRVLRVAACSSWCCGGGNDDNMQGTAATALLCWTIVG